MIHKECKKMLINISKIFVFLFFLILISCQSTDKYIEGYWINVDDKVVGFDYLRIDAGEILLQDCLGNYKYGMLIGKNQIQFKQGNDIDILEYAIMNDSVLNFQGIDYYLLNHMPNLDSVQEFDLLGLDTDVIFPPIDLGKEKWLKVKLRNSEKEYPLILGEKESKLDEILLFAPRTICSNTKPRNIYYDRVIIQVEKNASVKDLLNIEQQIYIEHRKRHFTIITDDLSFNSYQAVVDHKYSSGSLDSLIFEEVTNYLNVEWPPVPIFPYEESFYSEIRELNVVKVDSYFNFKNKDILFDRNNLIVISTDMKIEEYLSILSQIQNLRIEKGCTIYTHFLDYI